VAKTKFGEWDNWFREDAEICLRPHEGTGGTTPHVRECCGQHGRNDHRLKEMARTGQAGTGSVLTGILFLRKS
jgi:hypothetical protein